MPDDAERNPPIQEQMDGGELVRTRTVQDRQRGPAGCSGGILDAAQAPPRLDTDAHAPAPNAQRQQRRTGEARVWRPVDEEARRCTRGGSRAKAAAFNRFCARRSHRFHLLL